MLKHSSRHLARLAGTVVFALAGVPAHAQWNMYGNGGSFFVPITTEPNGRGGPPQYLVSLTLNGSNTNNFIMDTGSMGLVASSAFYTPNTALGDRQLANYATITYTTSSANPVGSLWLTNVQINNGATGQSVIARVPILAATQNLPDSFRQLGIGFDRPGIQIGPDSNPATLTYANASYNMNPFLALVSGPGVSTMQPGYIITLNGSNPGVTLGLNNQNTGGFSFQQLASAGGLPSYCNTPGMNCPLQWSAQNGSISITTGGQTYNLGSASQLPDSGISYMIVNAPNNTVPVGPMPYPSCSDQKNAPSNCLQSGSVSVYLPGQSTPAYSFTLADGNASTPFGVQVTQDSGASNLGRTFFNNLNYLYDPINGFVGYQAVSGTSGYIIPMLALQGTLALPNGFAASFPTFLMSDLTVQQTGSGSLGGAITGPGGLTLQSGNLTLGGVSSYAGGTNVNGGLLTIASTGSIIGDLTVNGGGVTNYGSINGNGLLTVNAGGTFTNNGTVNTPLQWQMNQGTFTNNNAFNGSLANTGTATNNGTITGTVINGTAGTFTNTGTITGNVMSNTGSFTNNGTIGGNFSNTGLLSGSGTIGGNLLNGGVAAPGNSIGTMTVSGNYSQTSGSVYATEVVGSGQSDRINVGGTAALGGTVFVSALPGMAFAPSTTYTILNATGGLNGTFAAVNELYPFLQSSLGYDANNVYLTLQVGGFAAQALNNTQYAVGAVLDANAPTATGDFATVLGTLAIATAQQGQAVMTALSGNNYAGFSTSMVQGMQLFMNNFANQSGGGGSPMSNRVALAEACDVACDATTPPKWGAWGGALGGLGTIGAGQPVGTVTYNAGGFAAGLDRLVTDTFRMGVTAGYSTGTQWVGGFDGLGRSNTFQVGLYGGFAQGKVYADGVIGYAYTQNQMWRNIAVPGLQQRTAYGQTGANQWYGQLETGYRFDLGPRSDSGANAFVTPFARLQAYTANQNAFTETGAQSLNLSVAQQTTNSLRSVIGAQLGGSMDLGWREKLAMQLRLGWSHEYADVGRPVTATLAGAPAMPFTTWGVSPQRDGVVIGLSANTAIAEATSVYLRYEGDVSAQDSAHAITAGVRMTW